MDAIEAGPRRHTRRTVVWALFGVVGLIMGAAWATGFAQSQSTTNKPSSKGSSEIRPASISALIVRSDRTTI